MTMVEQKIRQELTQALARRAEADEQIAQGRAMLRALELQRISVKEEAQEVKP